MIKFRSFPHYFQLSSNDCGHTCLQIICKYYGKYYDLEYIKRITGTNKAGVTAYDLIKASERLGYKSIPFSISYYKFRSLVPLPCIVHWQDSHFIVVYKITKKHVFVSDPAIGLKKMSLKEFANGWLKNNNSDNTTKRGMVIVLEPTPAFYSDNTSSRNTSYIDGLKYVWSYIKDYKKSIIHISILILLISFINSIFPILTQSIIDTGIPSRDYSFITLILISTIILSLSTAVADWIQQTIILHFSTRVKIRMISDYIKNLFKLPMSYFDSHLMGDIIQHNYDFDRIEASIMTSIFGALWGIIALVVFGSLLFIYDSVIFSIYIILSLVYITWILVFWSIRKRLDVKYFSYLSMNQSQWIELLARIIDIKSYNYGHYKRWQWERIQVKLYKSRIRLLHIEQIQKFGCTIINIINNALLIYLSVKSVISGEMTIGMLISVQYIIGQLTLPMSNIVNFITSSQLSYISYLRISEIEKIQLENQEITDTEDVMDFKFDLQIRHLSFRYTLNGPYVLKNISVVFPTGKVIALVGESGSGKSSLIKILSNLYKPTFGEVLIGNVNTNNISCVTWREHCGILLQESGLLKGTVTQNIIFGREYDKSKLIKAIERANIRQEIEKMPSSYDTMIGENGQGVSEGQKQRILFARAIYHEPEILLLDELTSSLDSNNEVSIISNIRTYFKEQTIVIAAHRLATIKSADIIIVLKSGCIESVGNHDYLIKNSKEYIRLFNHQL